MVDQPASQPYVDAPRLRGSDDVEHWSVEAAGVRLRRLARRLPFTLPDHPRFSGGAANDVWDLGDSFLKVCWRADRSRIVRDARVNQELPDEIPHARVRDAGETVDLSWVLSERVNGVALDTLTLNESMARHVARQMADTLSALHEWQPSPATRQILLARPALDPHDPLTIWASDLVILPVSRALALAPLAAGTSHVDAVLIDEVMALIDSLADADPTAGDASGLVGRTGDVVLHGDPSFGNWFIDDGEVTGLIDFEWTRWGPRDLDLVTLVFVSQLPRAEPRFAYLRWLEADYPDLFAAPDLDRRLWLYELIFFVRAIIWWPPNAPESHLAPEHHLHTLRRLLRGPLSR